MRKYFEYFLYVVRHKWYVMMMCFRFKLYWRGIVHDMSKFLPSEFIPYANYFGCLQDVSKGSPTDIKFQKAWKLHYNRNDHHPEGWFRHRASYLYDYMSPPFDLKDMSDSDLLEMIADWYGAGAAQGKRSPSDDVFREVRKWYDQNHKKIKINNASRAFVEYLIGWYDTPLAESVVKCDIAKGANHGLMSCLPTVDEATPPLYKVCSTSPIGRYSEPRDKERSFAKMVDRVNELPDYVLYCELSAMSAALGLTKEEIEFDFTELDKQIAGREGLFSLKRAKQVRKNIQRAHDIMKQRVLDGTLVDKDTVYKEMKDKINEHNSEMKSKINGLLESVFAPSGAFEEMINALDDALDDSGKKPTAEWYKSFQNLTTEAQAAYLGITVDELTLSFEEMNKKINGGE